jgi:PKHD-type hydroxylase
MSHYIFKPMPSGGHGDHPFTTWNNSLSDDEAAAIVRLADKKERSSAIIGDHDIDEGYRSSRVSWFSYGSETEWVFDRIAHIVGNINSQFYGFDIHGLCEDIQFTEYYASEKGHYDWHQDSGPNTIAPRKLSIVIQLSDPADYDGGDLQILASREPTSVDKRLGLATVFPSFILHRVTPVTRGTRRSLVAWIAGPKFR